MRRDKLILFLFLLIGFGLLNYPFVSQWVNRRSQSEVISNYGDNVDLLAKEEKETMLAAARAYNQNLADKQSGLADGFTSSQAPDAEYESLLNLSGDGVMGYIEIPSIDVMLPVYHGTGAHALSEGAGHLFQSSLPVGGEDTHTVISAHTGLASKAMFTDLDKLEMGDHFYIYILDEVLAYEVNDIAVVEPQDTEKLKIVPGEDLATLVTCTPYGINSHRLLVQGVRVPYVPEEQALDPDEKESGFWVWCRRGFIASVVILAAVALILMKPEKKGRKRKYEKEEPGN